MEKPQVKQFIPQARIPYDEICARLKQLKWGALKQVGLVSNYPFYIWKYSPRKPKGKILISAGIHGDEPSGVESVLFLLENNPSWLNAFDLSIFPCVNPWGYERNTRTNELAHDVNRQWRKTGSPEVRLCQKCLKGQHYDLTCCLHEDYDGTGFYLYELARSHSYYGNEIIQAVSKLLPIEKRKIVENRKCVKGVIERSPEAIKRRKLWPEALYHIAHHSEHTLTTETPTSFSIEKRIQSHCRAVQVALKLLSHDKEMRQCLQ
jgi:protein MpaA